MVLLYNSHTEHRSTKPGILRIEQITQIQIIMYRFTYNTLSYAFNNYFNLASDFHSHYKQET